MEKIDFVLLTEKQEYKQAEYLQSNYNFGNIIVPLDTLLSFKFPSFLQNETFYLDYGVVDPFTSTITYEVETYPIALNNTYKKTGYFESYALGTTLNTRYKYRIRAGLYQSYQILQPKLIGTIITTKTMTDGSGDSFVDVSGDTIISNL